MLKWNLPGKLDIWPEGILPNIHLSMTYLSVFSRDSVSLSFLIVALNDLYILVGDIQNAYLEAPKK